MDFLLQIKKRLIRILVVLIGFLFFTVYSVSVSANSINCEHEYHSCPSVDLKISEKSHPSTSQNLKNVVPVVHFSCKSNLLDYRNRGERFEAVAAKGVGNSGNVLLNPSRQLQAKFKHASTY